MLKIPCEPRSDRSDRANANMVSWSSTPIEYAEVVNLANADPIIGGSPVTGPRKFNAT